MWKLSIAEAKKMGILKENDDNVIHGTQKKRGSNKKNYGVQDRLFDLISSRYPEAQKEFSGAIPGRRFRLDVAIERLKLAIECDGWQYHGKFKQGFHRDRERDRLLTLNGWYILRFAASTILKDPWTVLYTVSAMVEKLESNSTGTAYLNKNLPNGFDKNDSRPTSPNEKITET